MEIIRAAILPSPLDQLKPAQSLRIPTRAELPPGQFTLWPLPRESVRGEGLWTFSPGTASGLKLFYQRPIAKLHGVEGRTIETVIDAIANGNPVSNEQCRATLFYLLDSSIMLANLVYAQRQLEEPLTPTLDALRSLIIIFKVGAEIQTKD